ncbi:hypothetical protein DLM78_05860 [Leptospira stimsonii]|uniref:Uncharacterized protein n=1 Tax=Leptospira stimsonii TaxID=2202203 RepID=A0A8B3CWA5_9LEPT|nr:hypothetical protein DLM78_05860 [Leptospira stimsonii]
MWELPRFQQRLSEYCKIFCNSGLRKFRKARNSFLKIFFRFRNVLKTEGRKQKKENIQKIESSLCNENLVCSDKLSVEKKIVNGL